MLLGTWYGLQFRLPSCSWIVGRPEGSSLETCVLPGHLGKLHPWPKLPAQGPPHPWPWTCLQVTLRLDTHPAMITVLEMGAARHFLRMQQLAKTQEERAQLLQPTLEVNPR